MFLADSGVVIPGRKGTRRSQAETFEFFSTFLKDQADLLKALEPEQGLGVPVVEATKPAQQKGDDAPGLLAASPHDK